MPTEEEVKNLSSSLNALTKQMEKISAQQIVQGKNVDEQRKSFEDIVKSSQKLEKSYDKQNGYLKEVAGNLKDSVLSTMKLGSTMTKIGTTMFAANIVKDMVDLDNKMTALSVRMGKGHAGIKELKTSVTDLQKEFGTSYENASMLIEELAKDKYIGNIKDAAAGIDLFSRATDVSHASVVELTNNLSKMGGLGTDSINAIYASMLKTQQSVGISDKGMNALVETINDMTSNMVAFGKTDKEIKQMAVETTALVGAFEKVGVSASRTTELVKQLTDPDRIEDNILLYSQLGVSMEDALSGNVDIGALDGQFKEMADRIIQMGPIAGSQFARSMGLSYKEVSRMAEVEAGAAEKQIAEAMTPEEQALETMKSLEKATEGIGKQFETGLNKMEGKIKSLPTFLLIGFSIIFPMIVKKAKNLFHKIFDKRETQATVNDAIVPAVEDSMRKAKAKSKRMSREMIDGKEIQASVADSVLPAVENTLRKAGVIIKGKATEATNIVKGKFGQVWDYSVVNRFFKGIDGKIDVLYAKSKRKNPAEAMFDAAKQNYVDSYLAKMQKVNASVEGLSQKFMGLSKDGKSLFDMLEKDGTVSVERLVDQTSHLDGAAKKTIDLIMKKYEQLNAQRQQYDSKITQARGIDPALIKERERLEGVKKGLLEEQDAYKNANEQINAIVNKRAENENRVKELRKQLQRTSSKAMKDAIQTQIDALNNENAAIDKNEGEWKKLQETVKGFDQKVNAENLNKVEQELNENTAALKKANEEANKPNGFFANLRGAAKYNIKTAFGNSKLGKEISGSVSRASVDEEGNQIALTGKQKFKAGAAGATMWAAKGAGKALLGPLKAMAKGIGSIFKAVGPTALIMTLVSRLLMKIQEPLNAMLDQIVDTLGPVIEGMLPAIESLINVIAKHILPPILTLLSGILKVANWILNHTLIPIMRGIGKLIPALKGPMDGVADALDKATGKDIQTSLASAAGTLKENGVSMEKSSEKMADSAEKMAEENEPVTISATGAQLVANGYTDPTTQANERMTSTTVYSENESKSKTIDDYQKEKEEKIKSERLENIQNNSGLLPKIAELLEKLIELITNENVNIYWEDPNVIGIENNKPL